MEGRAPVVAQHLVIDVNGILRQNTAVELRIQPSQFQNSSKEGYVDDAYGCKRGYCASICPYAGNTVYAKSRHAKTASGTACQAC